MRTFVFIFFFLPLFALAQGEGIRFESRLSWEELKAKAKAEGKSIFVDCYTSSCGWCRYMEKTAFTDEYLGTLINQDFVSVRLKCDASEKDSQEIKNWYSIAADFVKKYNIRSYPTYLFFDSNGDIVHKASGADSKRPVKYFFKTAEDSKNPDKQYYTLLKKYKEGIHSPEMRRSLIFSSQSAGETVTEQNVYNDYLKSQKDLFTKVNLELLLKMTRKSTDTGFKIMHLHPAKVDAIVGRSISSALVRNIIYHEEAVAYIFKGAGRGAMGTYNINEPDWNVLLQRIKKRYPDEANEVLAFCKIKFCEAVGYAGYGSAVTNFIAQFGDKLDAEELNEFAANVFTHCPDSTSIAAALTWSERALRSDADNVEYLCTYANLLYKKGALNEAIKQIMKAVDHAEDVDKPIYSEILEKMKKGEVTWGK